MSDPQRPTDAELEILTVLWSRGPCTVREVHDVIGKRRTAQYTTILKLMQIMAEKGLVRRDEENRAVVEFIGKVHGIAHRSLVLKDTGTTGPAVFLQRADIDQIHYSDGRDDESLPSPDDRLVPV